MNAVIFLKISQSTKDLLEFHYWHIRINILVLGICCLSSSEDTSQRQDKGCDVLKSLQSTKDLLEFHY